MSKTVPATWLARHEIGWLVALGLFSGCGPSSTSPAPKVTVAVAHQESADASDVDEAQFAMVKGRIVYSGDVPKLSPHVRHGMSKLDPAVCAAREDISDESLRVSGENHGVADVFVWLPMKPAGAPTESPGIVVPICFEDCRVRPRSIIGRTVDEFWFEFRDPTAHNLLLNPRYNATQCNNPGPHTVDKLRFNSSEKRPFEFHCAIHRWMGGSMLVLDHSYAAVTGEDGTFLIANMPPGDHQLHLWHEREFRDQLKVTLKAGEELDAGVISLTLTDGAKLTRSIER